MGKESWPAIKEFPNLLILKDRHSSIEDCGLRV